MGLQEAQFREAIGESKQIQSESQQTPSSDQSPLPDRLATNLRRTEYVPGPLHKDSPQKPSLANPPSREDSLKIKTATDHSKLELLQDYECRRSGGESVHQMLWRCS